MASTILSTFTQGNVTTSYTYTSGTPFVFPQSPVIGPASSSSAISYNTSNGIFTVNWSGVYEVNASIALTCGTASTDIYTAFLLVNGSTIAQGSTFNAQLGNSSPSYTACWVNTVLVLNSGDTFLFEISFTTGSGAVQTNSGSSTIRILLL